MSVAERSRTTKPTRHPIDVDAIPVDLRNSNQWVAWSWRQRGGKRDKPPFRVSDGRLCNSGKPEDLTTFEQAIAAVEAGRFDGVGFRFTDLDPFAGVDLDDCRNPETGEIEQWAAIIISTLNGYTEISPSGRGVKIFCRGKLPRSGASEGIEMYATGRYFTVTGLHLPGTPREIHDRTEQLADLHQAVFVDNRDLETTQRSYRFDDREVARDALRHLAANRADEYGTWIRTGMILQAVGADLLPDWIEFSQQSAKYVAGECERKWASFSPAGGVTLGTLIRWAEEDGWLPPWKLNGSAHRGAEPIGKAERALDVTAIVRDQARSLWELHHRAHGIAAFDEPTIEASVLMTLKAIAGDQLKAGDVKRISEAVRTSMRRQILTEQQTSERDRLLALARKGLNHDGLVRVEQHGVEDGQYVLVFTIDGADCRVSIGGTRQLYDALHVKCRMMEALHHAMPLYERKNWVPYADAIGSIADVTRLSTDVEIVYGWLLAYMEANESRCPSQPLSVDDVRQSKAYRWPEVFVDHQGRLFVALQSFAGYAKRQFEPSVGQKRIEAMLSRAGFKSSNDMPEGRVQRRREDGQIIKRRYWIGPPPGGEIEPAAERTMEA